MSAVNLLLSQLDRVQRRREGQIYASCPTSAHEHGDRSRGLAIRELDDGRVLVHCHAGCAVEDVLAAVGLTISDLYPDRPQPSRGSGRTPRLSARDALTIIRHEVTVCACVMGRLLDQRTVTTEELERCQEAVRRIHRVMGDVYGV